MKLRRATMADADLLLGWANDPDVRKQSFHTEVIKKEEHLAWLRPRVASPDAQLLIVMENEVPIGNVRYERHPDRRDQATVSIAVSLAHRGKGYSSRMLRQSLDEVFSSGFCAWVTAYVRETNTVSRALFEKAGFQPVPNTESAQCPGGLKFILSNAEFWKKVCGISCLAVIPARGGSKRIPRKNIKPFLGKPIIAYSIEAAVQSGLFESVVVSTDSPEIAAVARDYGAVAPFVRPADLADDFTPLAPVLLHALGVAAPAARPPAYLCGILPAAPFVTPARLVEGFRIIRAAQAPAAFTVTAFPSSIYRALVRRDDGTLELRWPEYELTRSNDLPQAYYDAGQLYWLQAASFAEQKKIFMNGAVPILCPPHQVVDIDTPEDWETAERLYQSQDPAAKETP